MGDAITKTVGAKVRVREITDADVRGVIDLLMRGFPERGRRFWVDVLARLTQHVALKGLPKLGYLLECDRAPVGVILQIYSKVSNGGEDGIRCCVSSWDVEAF